MATRIAEGLIVLGTPITTTIARIILLLIRQVLTVMTPTTAIVILTRSCAILSGKSGADCGK